MKKRYKLGTIVAGAALVLQTMITPVFARPSSSHVSRISRSSSISRSYSRAPKSTPSIVKYTPNTAKKTVSISKKSQSIVSNKNTTVHNHTTVINNNNSSGLVSHASAFGLGLALGNNNHHDNTTIVSSNTTVANTGIGRIFARILELAMLGAIVTFIIIFIKKKNRR